MAIILRGAGMALPRKKVLNKDLATALDTSDEWIKTHTGIESRYLAQEDEKASTLATKACLEALEKSETKIDVSEIELIAISTATGDYSSVPSTACLVQAALGAKNAAAFDVCAACAGFLYTLDTVCALMKSHGYKYAIACGSEVLSRIANWSDRSTCVLFGDGAGAMLLENTEATGSEQANDLACSSAGVSVDGFANGKKRDFGPFILGADGTGEKALYADENGKLVMDGHAVYDFAVGVMTKTILQLMEKENLTIDDVDYFLCHQANERILRAAAKRLGFPKEKFIVNIAEFANMSSACIPLAFAQYFNSGKIKHGMTIISAAFGAGLTWSGCVMRI